MEWDEILIWVMAAAAAVFFQQQQKRKKRDPFEPFRPNPRAPANDALTDAALRERNPMREEEPLEVSLQQSPIPTVEPTRENPPNRRSYHLNPREAIIAMAVLGPCRALTPHEFPGD